ncbi:glycosyltransferase family 2 protein [Curvivirga aplysinae]|uniref:glycosyltransferase family 2 protein n=1 Tax=Curvivirga aplysinae TaxID=2529852 RepID=UPI0012BC4A77|nr:glycosyltransferase family 2 protein [Curvivirga aplysinae]MTI11030.1 glycosyltransferase family 2 protein [Curvivirga aplysinae]
MNFRLCVVIPCYNHPRVIESLAKKLVSEGHVVLIIDDGSSEPTRSIVANLHDPDNHLYAHHLDVNQGKGKAVIHGFELAKEMGFTHVLQVDADGQHDLEAIPDLIALAEKHPRDLITGVPVYDDTIPLSRKIGRWITHIWVWIETLSFQIKDSMCGFRVYPLEPVSNLLNRRQIGLRMDFDIEIMVRLAWDGIQIRNVPVKVTYPADNTSNFQTFEDNIRISKMHSKLFFEMLFRMPVLLMRKMMPASGKGDNLHWSERGERGMYWGICFLAGAYKLFGRSICLAILQPILLYFFLSQSAPRKASISYLEKVFRALGKTGKVSWRQSFRHFQHFGRAALDKLAVWTGDIGQSSIILPENPDFQEVVKSGQGIVVLTSHLGNIEIARALSSNIHQIKITVFAHTKNAIKFNRMLTYYNPAAAIDMIEVTEMGPATAIEMEERLQRGEWIVIASDRTPVDAGRRVSKIDFLGQEAYFPQGGVILASLLKAPTYMMLCMEEGDRYRLVFDKLAEKITLPRRNKEEAIIGYQKQYTTFLEKYCMRYPYQWFNFFDFWNNHR